MKVSSLDKYDIPMYDIDGSYSSYLEEFAMEAAESTMNEQESGAEWRHYNEQAGKSQGAFRLDDQEYEANM